MYFVVTLRRSAWR